MSKKNKAPKHAWQPYHNRYAPQTKYWKCEGCGRIDHDRVVAQGWQPHCPGRRTA